MEGWTISLTFLAIIAGIIYLFLKHRSKYWDRRGVPTVADNVVTGGMTDWFLQRTTPAEAMRRIYEKTKQYEFFGTFMFARPLLIVRDPQIIKGVLLDDFANFPGNGFFANEEKDPLGGTLFNLSGPKWKALRAKLSHAFTASKLKYMFGTMMEVIDRVHRVFEKKIAESGKNVDVREIMACLGTDIIASVAFGIDVNSVENPDNEFREIGRRISTPDFFFFVRILMLATMHKLADFFNISQVDSKSHAFIVDLVKRTVEYREKNNVIRPDFMNMLIQLKNRGYIEGTDMELPDSKSESQKPITMNELTAQVFIFFQAGFETSTSTVTFTLYELCLNKNVKEELLEEVDKAMSESGGKITYDLVQSLPYLDRVVAETLRLHPPVGAMMRQAGSDCYLPSSKVQVKKGTAVGIPIMGLHMDPQYFPHPEKFCPERFTKEEKALRPSFVYMPFGEGQRICIGMRFGLLQVKTVLLALLSRYDFEISEETPYPLKLDPKGMIPFPLKLSFNVSKRTDTTFA